jgi:hypothetical protein
MKINFTLILSLFTITLFGQSPNYDETVDYIEKQCLGRMLYQGDLDSYQRETGHKLTKIDIQKNGRIKLVADQKYGNHDFEIVFNIFDLKSSIEYPEGIRAYKFLVHFQGLNVTSEYGITYATEADAQRVARAFRHLKTMCNKSKNLFDSPISNEKKPALSKVETIKYISKLINNQAVLTGNSKLSSGKNANVDYKQTFTNTSFTTETTVIIEEDGAYFCRQEKEEHNSITNLQANQIKIYPPNPNLNSIYKYTDAIKKEYFYVKIDYYEITYPIKYKQSSYYKGNYWPSPSQAKNSCNLQQWTIDSHRDEGITVYFETESKAKRFKKALEHLNNLIQEEKANETSNDPFSD